MTADVPAHRACRLESCSLSEVPNGRWKLFLHHCVADLQKTSGGKGEIPSVWRVLVVTWACFLKYRDNQQGIKILDNDGNLTH